MDSPERQPEDTPSPTQGGETAQISDILVDAELFNDESKQSAKQQEVSNFAEEKEMQNNTSVSMTDNSGDKFNVVEAELHSETQSIENQHGAGDQTTENDYGDVTVKVIDVPDDDDLFDLISQPPQEDKLMKTELYKYLTEEGNMLNPHAEEVTPYQSGDEHDREEDSEDSTGSSSEDSDSSSSGGEYEEITEEILKEVEESQVERKELPQVQEEEKSFEMKVRRNPGRQSNVKKKTGKKKTSVSKPYVLTDTTLEKLENAKHVTNKWLKDLSIPENLTFSQPLNMKIGELNQYLTCGLCKGYLYEASTITECMHTFCKNCIVRHCMEVSLHCPVCSILIHPTDPFVNIRLDRMIQDIVYKILPSVAETEMRRIEEFYAEHPEVEPKEIQLPPAKPKVSPKEVEKEPVKMSTPSHIHVVSLLLEAEEQNPEQETLKKKFVRVSSEATVGSVCDFLKRKLSLHDQHRVDLFCCGDAVEESACTLDTIKQNFFGDQEELMLLQYRVRET